MNKVMLGGMLTSNIKEVSTATGTKMCTFSLAVRRKGDTSKMEKDTDFFNCVCFSSTANYVLTYCGKGDYVNVIGKIQNSKYKDKDGVDKLVTQIYVEELDRIRVAKSRDLEDERQPVENTYSNNGFTMPTMEDDDDLPF